MGVYVLLDAALQHSFRSTRDQTDARHDHVVLLKIHRYENV